MQTLTLLKSQFRGVALCSDLCIGESLTASRPPCTRCVSQPATLYNGYIMLLPQSPHAPSSATARSFTVLTRRSTMYGAPCHTAASARTRGWCKTNWARISSAMVCFRGCDGDAECFGDAMCAGLSRSAVIRPLHFFPARPASSGDRATRIGQSTGRRSYRQARRLSTVPGRIHREHRRIRRICG